MDELIICVAPYPGEKQDEKFPGVMDVADEVIRSYEAGAAIAHLHVRDQNGLQVTDISWFQRDLDKIRSACPIIIEGSTGGAPEHTLAERCVSFSVPGVEMGTLNLGSVNMYDGVYDNPIGDMRFYATELKKRDIKPLLIIFDLSHFSYIESLTQAGLIAPPYDLSLVLTCPTLSLTRNDI